MRAIGFFLPQKTNYNRRRSFEHYTRHFRNPAYIPQRDSRFVASHAPHAPAIVPTHSNECIGVSRNYNRIDRILEHGECDANKPSTFVCTLNLPLTSKIFARNEMWSWSCSVEAVERNWRPLLSILINANDD